MYRFFQVVRFFHFWEVKMERPDDGFSDAAKKAYKKAVNDYKNELLVNSKKIAMDRNRKIVNRLDILKAKGALKKRELANIAFLSKVKSLFKIFILNDRS
jgi:histone H3/H4